MGASDSKPVKVKPTSFAIRTQEASWRMVRVIFI